jgi:hypothetical protein
MPYLVYEAVSPSGKRYVGLTRSTLQKRWAEHVRKAAKDPGRHPLRDAIRKYGAEAFKVGCIAQFDALEDAAAAEHYAIWMHETTNRAKGYNISEGYDYDAQSGVDAMRAKMADPVWRAAYRERLSAGIKATFAGRDLSAQIAGLKRWRGQNPRLAYKLSARNVRLAGRAQGRPRGSQRDWTVGSFGRLWIPGERVLLARRRYLQKDKTRAQWAALTPEAKADVGRAISTAIRAAHTREGKPERDAQLAQARARVDRAKQGAAASKGLKAYWARVKADPEAYQALMERKKEKLRGPRQNV